MKQNNLIFTNSFLDFFMNQGFRSSKSSAHWQFYKSLKGNKDNFADFFKILELFNTTFSWIFLQELCVPRYEEIFIKDQMLDNWFNKENVDYEEWKRAILKISTDELPFDEDFQRYMDGVYSFNNTKFIEGLKLHITWYTFNKNTDTTDVGLFVEIRGEPFYENPWGLAYPKFTLPKDYLEYNRKLLKESIQQLEKAGFVIESHGFEWGETHPNWAIDKYGFIDKESL